MSDLARSFFAFLLEKHKRTGQNDFMLTDYMDFVGYKAAIDELCDIGIIERTNDILGTIIVRPSGKP